MICVARERKGFAQPPVEHFSYVMRQSNGRAYGHHETGPGWIWGQVYQCGICDRWVFRGMGRWWENA